MTDITNFRPDDLGTRALEQENAAPRQTTPSSPVAPVAPVRSRQSPGADRRRGGSGEWKGPERRSGRDRRQRQVPVLLDTRSHRERRRSPQQAEDGVTYRRIDEIVE